MMIISLVREGVGGPLQRTICFHIVHYEESEGTKGVITIRLLKMDRQYNNQKER